jgi:hypothetical protein
MEFALRVFLSAGREGSSAPLGLIAMQHRASSAVFCPHSPLLQSGMKQMPGILLAIAYTALFTYLMQRSPFFARVPGLGMRAIASLFLLKIAAGTALWAIYTYVYPDRSTADIFKYFDDSRVLYDSMWTSPWDFLRMLIGVGNDTPHFTEHYYLAMNNWVRRFETNVYNDSHTLIRFNAVLRLFSFGYYHVHTVFACFLSTAGLVALFRALRGLVPSMERGLALGVFIWPSVLLWSSGPLKESLLMLGLGFFLMGALSPWRELRRWRGPAAIGIGFALMLVVKPYVLLCLLPGLIAWWWCRRSPSRTTLRFTLVHALIIGGALIAGRFSPALDPLLTLAMKQSDFIGMVREVGSGSMIDVPHLQPELLSFVQQVPSALRMAFISPFEVALRNPLTALSGVENVMVLGLPLLALAFRKRWAHMDAASLLFALSFILLLALLIGWTVPVVGALVRYRVPLLPFIAFASLLVLDPQRLPSRWRKFFQP